MFEIDQPGPQAWKRQRLVQLGYGVPAHLKALSQLGPTVHHRRSFAPVARLYGEADIAEAAEETESRLPLQRLRA